MRKYCGAFLFLIINLSGLSQFYKFEVIHLPAVSNYNKQTLTTELQKARDKQMALKIIEAKKFPPLKIVIKLNNPDKSYTWWTIDTRIKTNKENDTIVVRSRNTAVLKFYKLSDFKSFFSDTIAMIDSLKVELYISDTNYPIDHYFFNVECDGSKKARINILARDNALVFYSENFSQCARSPIHLQIINDNNSNRVLASFSLSVLDEDDKKLLLDIALDTKGRSPLISYKELSEVVIRYANNNYGRLYQPALTQWLQNQLRN